MKSYITEHIETHKEAILENGHIVRYDFCSHDRYAYLGLFYRFLGAGYIYSINGVRQTDNQRKFFWEKTK